MIAEFIAAHPGQVRVFQTRIGAFCAAERQSGFSRGSVGVQSGFTGRQKGMGEAAISEFVNRLDEVVGDADHPAFVVFEDADVLSEVFIPGPRTVRLSTAAYVRALAQAGVLDGIERVLAIMRAAGRGGRDPISPG